MELRQVRYFIMVAEELNFTRAAQRLHMAQPPLSQQIKALEAELGFPLLLRTTRHVELTAAGKFLNARFSDLLEELNRTVAEASEIASGARGVIRIGFVGSASYDVLNDVMAYMRKHLPDVRVHVESELLTPQIEDRLKRGELDMAIVRPPVTSGDLELEELRSDPFLLAVSSDDPLASSTEPVDLADLRDRIFVSYPANAAAAICFYAAARDAGFLPRVEHQADKTSTLLTLVGSGAGIAVVPAGSLAGSRFQVNLRPLTGIPPIGLSLCTIAGSKDPLVVQICGAIRSAVARQ